MLNPLLSLRTQFKFIYIATIISSYLNNCTRLRFQSHGVKYRKMCRKNLWCCWIWKGTIQNWKRTKKSLKWTHWVTLKILSPVHYQIISGLLPVASKIGSPGYSSFQVRSTFPKCFSEIIVRVLTDHPPYLSQCHTFTWFTGLLIWKHNNNKIIINLNFL